MEEGSGRGEIDREGPEGKVGLAKKKTADSVFCSGGRRKADTGRGGSAVAK